MDILIQVLQFILSLSILVVLHEMGHFLPAVWFKTKVEKFYLFFDPYFSLFKFKRGDTEYGIGWLPLGGYVKIAGMIDESMDKEQMKLPPQPWEFRSKPAWQRLIIMVGGVTVNVLLGIFIFWMLLLANGKEYIPLKNLTYGAVAADSALYELGFNDGDKIIGIKGLTEQPKTLEEFNNEILLENGNVTITIERAARWRDITIPEGFSQKLMGKDKGAYFAQAFPTKVDSLFKGENAEKAGLKKGDLILGVNDVQTPYYFQFKQHLLKNKDKSILLLVLRGADTLRLKGNVTNLGTLGFYPIQPEKFFKTEKETYNLFTALPAAVEWGWTILSGYAKSFKLIFTKEGASQLGGFASITKQYSTTWDWTRFWTFTAILSFILAFMNILPIPALDGGHVVFLLYEVVTGRKPSEKVMEIGQYVGLVLVLGLLLFANGNDIYRYLIK